MNNRPSWLRAAGLLAAVAVVLAACGSGAATSPPAASQPPASSPTPATGSAEPGSPSPAAPSGEPIVVGSTLSLTGAFAATGAIHQIVGEQFVDRLNASGGLLGRPVEWVVRDDESDQAKVAQLYETLISQDGVDLIMGPYATPNILSAMAVAERHGFVLPQHTAVIAPLLTYECQFPSWSIGYEPNVYVPTQLYEAVATLPNPPQTVAFVTNQNGSTDFVTRGLPDDESDPDARSIARDKGLEIVADIAYPPGTTEWAPIATQLQEADPDLIVNNSLGVDTVGLIQAMKQLGYQPPLTFSLFPAPGPLLGLGADAEGVLSVSIFEANEPLLEQYGPEVRTIVEEFEAAATEAGLPYTAFETQATASWNAWEILVAGVEGAGNLEHEAICDSLHTSGAETTFSGNLTFDPAQNNFWPSNQGIKQIQDGTWVMVWPEDRAAAPLKPVGS
ncbi:MAG TPA: ABC transporter substrate-binding protein [Clostridia bacterium]|nr:ABC transporter substrate-binding protein [Clostridia bacterium]